MISYAICEIKGKQYKVLPGKPFLVDLENDKNPEAPVLLMVDEKKISLGKPYLKDKLKLEVLENNFKAKKIRVAKFHAKANYRKVQGSRATYTKLIYNA